MVLGDCCVFCGWLCRLVGAAGWFCGFGFGLMLALGLVVTVVFLCADWCGGAFRAWVFCLRVVCVVV